MYDRSVVLDGRCRCVDGAVTRRETGKDQSFFVVVLTQYLVVAQIVAVADAESTPVV